MIRAALLALALLATPARAVRLAVTIQDAKPSPALTKSVIDVVRQRLEAYGVPAAKVVTKGPRELTVDVDVPAGFDAKALPIVASSPHFVGFHEVLAVFKAGVAVELAQGARVLQEVRTPGSTGTRPQTPGEKAMGEVVKSAAQKAMPGVPVTEVPAPPREAKQYMVRATPEIEDADIREATVQAGPYGEAEIQFDMTPEGTRKLGEVTQRVLHRQLAIVMADEVYMAPEVQTPITAGKVQITGRFDSAVAGRIAALLRVPRLPAGITAKLVE